MSVEENRGIDINSPEKPKKRIYSEEEAVKLLDSYPKTDRKFDKMYGKKNVLYIKNLLRGEIIKDLDVLALTGEFEDDEDVSEYVGVDRRMTLLHKETVLAAKKMAKHAFKFAMKKGKTNQVKLSNIFDRCSVASVRLYDQLQMIEHFTGQHLYRNFIIKHLLEALTSRIILSFIEVVVETHPTYEREQKRIENVRSTMGVMNDFVPDTPKNADIGRTINAIFTFYVHWLEFMKNNKSSFIQLVESETDDELSREEKELEIEDVCTDEGFELNKYKRQFDKFEVLVQPHIGHVIAIEFRSKAFSQENCFLFYNVITKEIQIVTEFMFLSEYIKGAAYERIKDFCLDRIIEAIRSQDPKPENIIDGMIVDIEEVVEEKKETDKETAEKTRKKINLRSIRDLSGKRVVSAVKRILGDPIRISGSHHVFRRKEGNGTYPISIHKSESVGIGLLKKCLREWGVSVEELIEAL